VITRRGERVCWFFFAWLTAVAVLLFIKKTMKLGATYTLQRGAPMCVCVLCVYELIYDRGR
jgi:hypothetical protein